MNAHTMTLPRRRRKPGRAPLLAFAAVLAVAALGRAVPLGAATTEQVVVDRRTGLAISGIDPVTYFVDGAPKFGKEDYELRFAGAVWRFRNEGNRAAFVADPQIYGPQFGGYDPVGVARGIGVAGNPSIWLIAGERLYLFHSHQTRDEFKADIDEIATTADRMWPATQLTLSP